jgi:lipoyl(octanoyl) transferase
MRPDPVQDMAMDPVAVRVRHHGVVDYAEAVSAMRAFNAARDAHTTDEIWLLQHPPVYTRGLSCKQSVLVADNAVPVVDTDRGGQMTYHGPGQLVAYVLMDLRRRHWGIRQLVDALEQSVIDLLATQNISAQRREGAPGVYVNDAKIAALGLRVRQGTSYHGLSLNVDMDLAPFSHIDPCGYAGLRTTRLRDLGVDWGVAQTAERLLPILEQNLHYDRADIVASALPEQS